jgi:CBS domain-containing protein
LPQAPPVSERSGYLERRLAAEQQTLAQSLRTLVRKEPVVCREDASVREAVALMKTRDVGSVVVVDARSHPVGIFTTADLVPLAEHGLDRPLAEVMTRSPFEMPAHAMAYEAALAMMGMGIRHVLVMDDSRLIGVVSERDLFSLQRLGLGEITTEIRLAARVDLLVEIAAEIRKLARLLVEQGVAAEPLTLFVSVLNDRLCQRILEVERKNHQWGDIGWCWLAFGSEGRFEQTFSTDQDNGLLFVAHDDAPADTVRKLLLPFARRVNEALDACGFPLCKGDVMASSPKLCLSLEEWRARMRSWVNGPDPSALLDAAICFDFRPLHGDATLAAALRETVFDLTRANPAFLRHMAEIALESRPPLGLLRDFVTSDAPGSPHSVNLKLNGARPFVDAARIYALAHGLPQTNTGARLRAARSKTGMGEAETEALVGAFFVIQGLRLKNQADPALGEDRANRIDPDALNELERHILKAAFGQARKLQSRLALDYQI